MDLFKAQFDRISRQLSGLTPSQKMLTVALVAIMVMTLIWWGKYAAEPETVALFSQPPSTAELAAAQAALSNAGIKATESSGNLMVPADERARAYAMLAFNHALPHETKDTFDEIAKSISPLASESSADQMWNHARELAAEQMISEFNDDITSARVRIQPLDDRRLTPGASVQPSAVASINTRDHKVPAHLVDAAADLLQGSVSNIPRANIKIIVNGAPQHVTGERGDGVTTEEQIAAVQQAETLYTDRAQAVLNSSVPGAFVTVTVQINASQVNEKSIKYDPKTSVSKEKEIMSNTSETTGPTPTPQEAGVVPNTGFSNAPAPASGNGASSTREQNSTKLENYVGRTDTETNTPAGETKPVSAAVTVPISYYTNVYKGEHPDTKGQPTATMMKDIIDREEKNIRSLVKGATGMTQDSEIFVTTAYGSSEEPVPAPVATAGMSLRLFTPHHIKEGLLGVMALASLFMVSSLVKKGATVPVATGMTGITTSETPTAASTLLGSGEMMVGEVAGGDPTLDAVELDEEAIRAQQVVEQVSKLVKENPDSAAAMVKRWMSRT